MAFMGMDIAQARQLETRLQTEADRLVRLASDLRSRVDASAPYWKGPDATAFRARTWPEVDTLLGDVQASLLIAKATIETQRLQQERASAAG